MRRRREAPGNIWRSHFTHLWFFTGYCVIVSIRTTGRSKRGTITTLPNSEIRDGPSLWPTGHFRRESYVALHMPRCCPGSLAPVFVPVPVRSLRPHNVRTRLAFGQLLEVVRHSRPDSKFVFVGGAGGAFGELLRHLEQPSCQVVVSVDAFWKVAGSNAYTRPFAGMRARPFSIGAAKLSRLAQCPIVACATHVANDGTVVLEWGTVMPPPEPDDEAADFQTINTILDFMEEAIGRRPAQYVLYIGEERRWNPVLHTWEDRGAEVR